MLAPHASIAYSNLTKNQHAYFNPGCSISQEINHQLTGMSCEIGLDIATLDGNGAVSLEIRFSDLSDTTLYTHLFEDITPAVWSTFRDQFVVPGVSNGPFNYEITRISGSQSHFDNAYLSCFY
eukprot:Awhi_evm2s5473